jgi:hypothetical protein
MKRTPQNAITHPVPQARAALRDPGGAVTDLYTFDAPARGTTGSTRPRIHIDGLEALDVLRYVATVISVGSTTSSYATRAATRSTFRRSS